MQFRKKLIAGCVVMILVSCSVSPKGQKTAVQNTLIGQSDSTKKASKDTIKAGAPKAYKEVITANALTSRGMFTIHKVNDRYFFEIPESILDKDILLVSRIAQGAAGDKGGAGYAGDEIGQSIIRFSKGPGYKLFIRLMSFTDRSVDSSANGMFRSLRASNLQPIQAAFEIKSIRSDSTSYVIDVTDFLNSDNPLLYLDAVGKKALMLGGYQKDRSYIVETKAFPLNVELLVVNTYLNNEQPKTYGLNVSFVLLPKQAMRPRYFDKRVGYFTQGYMDYDVEEGVEPTQVITRWRLEPRDEDREKYLRGELVEPKKPIVYYIDPTTPIKWIPYLIQAVNDWQETFEKAGFKNAIYALEAPTDDSSFSLYDARHNAIVYKASPIQNASGPVIYDPRTGEILETHINWYHNIQQLLQSWYMIQASPNDCGAQKMVFDEKLMGQLIRFACSHEVGHTLGLRHNMGASSTMPTDSLRSKTYVEKNGFCASIMDYARFNYVAQPEDGLTRNELIGRIGVYDEWVIEWGYRWLPQLKTKEEEIVYMDKWISTQLAQDKRLWWGEFEPGQQGAMVFDPRRQSEDVGDDAMKAGYYGIQNLKRVMSHLREWTKEPGKDYQDLNRMYKQVVAQYGLYMMHVANNIGNKYWTEKTPAQPGTVVQFIPKTVQKRAMQFLAKELFDAPSWLYNKDLFSVIGGSGDYVYWSSQVQVINWLITYDNYETMSYAQMQQPKDAYSFDEFLTDMDNEIWKELKAPNPISLPRRNLQKIYTERMILYSMPIPGSDPREPLKLRLDFYPLVQKHIRGIISKIDKQLPNYKDETSQLHLKEVKKRLQQALNFARFPQANAMSGATNKPFTGINNFGIEKSAALFPTIDPIKHNVQQGSIKCDYWEFFNFQENLLINHKQ